jgi:hypothetical protein
MTIYNIPRSSMSHPDLAWIKTEVTRRAKDKHWNSAEDPPEEVVPARKPSTDGVSMGSIRKR